jgi:glutamate-1-semialdehyde 2,1-aminomutase
MDTFLDTNSRIVAAYRARTPGSAVLAREAAELLPSGITHDARYLEPYGIYIERAAGPRKWDVDGNQYVDYFGGHGALLLGHNHPVVGAAIEAALANGTHFGANHPGELRWATAIRRLVPSAERVRFTSSGTEATLMAVRLARAATGRGTLIRFKGHFHGWHDHMTSGYANHFDGSPTPGVVQGVADKVTLLEPGDSAALEATLAGGDVAAVIVEPTGSSFGQVPLRAAFLHEMRRLTERYGTLLILDEVITGFRVAPGGAQAAFGVRADLASFAKIVAGGLPGAAVAGRADILDRLDFAAAARTGQEKVQHPGTFNANPVSAAAGTAALGVIAEGDANARADATAAELRAALNEVLSEAGVPWAVYGTFSGFHLFVNARGREVTPGRFDPYAVPREELKEQPKQLVERLRLALLLEGVDVGGRIGGFISATHGPAEIEDTVRAFRAAIGSLRAEGEIA